jgi:hypothetical protein
MSGKQFVEGRLIACPCALEQAYRRVVFFVCHDAPTTLAT